MEKYLLEEWTQTETELMRERGLWGPVTGTELDKWMLDTTEGRKSRERSGMPDIWPLASQGAGPT